MTIDMTWNGGVPNKIVLTVDKGAVPRNVQVVYRSKTITAFQTVGGLVLDLVLLSPLAYQSPDYLPFYR